VKSPLRDPNKAQKGLATIKELIPEKSTIHTFFLSFGTIEIPLAFHNRTVISHTSCAPIYNFWHCVLRDPERIANFVDDLFPPYSEKEFYLLQEQWTKAKDPFLRAALFFLLNRCSEAGNISFGQMNINNFTSTGLSRLKNFEVFDFRILHDEAPLNVAFEKVNNSEYILLPAGNFSVSEKHKHLAPEDFFIPHQKLSDLLLKEEKKLVITYNFHPEVTHLYKDKNIIMINKFGMRTDNQKTCKELVIANF